MHSPLEFLSDNPTLNRGFDWAKAQALAYVFSGDPVGNWYEAALPGRAAFCMRDVSHQAAGAHLLGLAPWNFNMLQRFAANISAERDWCSLWEIDKFNRPCPADYRDDRYFWYNFPANFDVLDCCFRQYLWTGDRRYLEDASLRFFYAKSVNDYVHRWDLDGDGLLEHYPQYGFRGIATYNEEIKDPWMGADLIAAQYAAYQRYASLMELEGRNDQAVVCRRKAIDLQIRFARDWWDADHRRFYGFVTQDKTFVPDPNGLTGLLALYFHLIDSPEKISAALDEVLRLEPSINLESRSYIPEVLYRYGRAQAADRVLRALCDPDLPRREYPELSFAVIGAFGMGLMGIEADARERMLRTFPQLSADTAWAELKALPVFDAQISVRHTGQGETSLTLHSGQTLFWQAAFPGRRKTITVDGTAYPASQAVSTAGEESYVLIRACAGETHTAAVVG